MKLYKIAVIGQGYVGLPLSLEFSDHYSVLGYDINPQRVEQLNNGNDITLEADLSKLNNSLSTYSKSNGKLGYRATSEISDISDSNVYIVTVPTPIDKYNAPDLVPLISASRMLGKIIKKGDIIIYESTVFPGCTEEECVPILEQYSGLKYNEDFFVGYSPERINPGDKINTLTSVKKVTSGSTEEIAEEVDQLYKKIITAGTHKAPSLKVAEASKAIENAQRDVNISFVNELALIFDRIGIDTHDVLEAAGTKYNFLKYKPGLVGGHCISVDPYYLAHKAEQLGYHPDVILSGRRVNDSIAKFVASKVVKLQIAKGGVIKNSNAIILGITFKENCPDVRNTKVVDIYNELKDYGVNVDIYDPWASKEEVKHEYGIDILDALTVGKKYDSVIIAVAHDEFLKMDLNTIKNNNSVVFDTKACIDRSLVDARL
ncbi:nucleotide sugar dehydrogenase [Chryseobacterium indoltheticum]|uniref:UDP-N-acetyl-D-galactosamine dehydrogenase n=1 Tax=Chryseobacterium indoltheticum TaxID=254 RepID=A0A381F548_9FLAO|nr:nucleotide sugar dehydrogenase [Chryseobacterium indoltheticum]AZA75234.1 nucleotide sugar dehydrogenase [Chryseobacterium indoltheticum]SIR15369.1 UDP-N-acetyl-D-galactosamine dehydrogenase [Chryseobacterium indoltheticum]SUX41729.1 UDP-glucose 6-dehydrogenase tuaD [Chryseobacterium indoltheticum]